MEIGDYYPDPDSLALRVGRPVSRRISHRPPSKKIFGLATIDFAKPPATGQKKIG